MTPIRLHSGHLVDLARPRVDDIDLDDIAWALAHLCRFTGHTSRHYSVAEHSLRVARIVALISPEHYLAALLHDATEAYLGDISRPLKQIIAKHWWSRYRRLERAWARVIGQKFKVTLHPLPWEVHYADRELCEAESVAFLRGGRPLLPFGNAEEVARLFRDETLAAKRATA